MQYCVQSVVFLHLEWVNLLSYCTVTEVFVPCPDGLLVNLHEAKEMVIDFLNKLPVWFEKNMQTGSALGPALQAAYKLLVSLL